MYTLGIRIFVAKISHKMWKFRRTYLHGLHTLSDTSFPWNQEKEDFNFNYAGFCLTWGAIISGKKVTKN